MARRDKRGSQAPQREELTGWRKLARRLFVWGGSLAVVGLLVLTVSVWLTAR